MKSDSLRGHSEEIRTTRLVRSFFLKGIHAMNVVFVLSPDEVPLMPCASVIARLLLKEGKARVVHRTPFTIQLSTRPETTYTQPLTLGVDTGSSVVGSAVADDTGKVFYLVFDGDPQRYRQNDESASVFSSQPSQPQNALSPGQMAQPQEFDQSRTFFTHHEKQDRCPSAGNSLCAILIANYVHCIRNRNL